MGECRWGGVVTAPRCRVSEGVMRRRELTNGLLLKIAASGFGCWAAIVKGPTKVNWRSEVREKAIPCGSLSRSKMPRDFRWTSRLFLRSCLGKRNLMRPPIHWVNPVSLHDTHKAQEAPWHRLGVDASGRVRRHTQILQRLELPAYFWCPTFHILTGSSRIPLIPAEDTIPSHGGNISIDS